MKYIHLFLSLIILSALLVTIKPSSVYAQDASTNAAIIKYDLAYPGILPDSPLYKIKVIRNKIIDFLINDPMKKINFYLLNADKGILASAILIDKHEIKLSEETLLKAENNFTLLTFQLGRLAKKPDDAFFKRLTDASLKHQEVITSMIKRVPENDKKVFEQVLSFSKRNLQTIKDYQSQIIISY